MLAEWFKSLTASCPACVRKTGLLRELLAIEARGRRCREFWRPHLDRCKKMILEAAEAAPGRRLAVILGSGPLFDVPLEELAAMFERVVLADAAHLPAARRRARKLHNVELATLDLTGLLDAACSLAKRGGRLAVSAPEVFLDEGPDLVASVNLASQLPLPFLSLLKKTPGYDKAALAALSGEIIAAHFTWLSRFTGQVCLITDLAWIYAEGEEIIEEEDALGGLEPPPGGERWIWDVAPRGEQSREYCRRNLVAGYVRFGPPGLGAA
jgi:hypothetical protein